ncbi:MAG: tRNA (adenosine(37)-N6)-dimethylallyltransferase MiaA [Candidatus Omnitrophica bacterium]|nr:tRNA (adenosine(37)-N6)-dimethylallyltransferase MiaA [Candidatus Omnitrophota bacterium]
MVQREAPEGGSSDLAQSELANRSGAVFLAGPTAVGKSGLAMSLARALGGEIVSVDSMQVYRGMDIGTAKPLPADRRAVPHHLIDVAPINEPFDAAQFVRCAKAAVEEIRSRGHFPIFCGGTGLYFKAYCEGLGQAPAPDTGIRSELESMPLPDLLVELSRKDPLGYARIDRKNRRRVIRALEVVRQTGKSLLSQQSPWSRSREIPLPDKDADAAGSCFIGLERQGSDLHQRINARVEEMFKRGLVEETRQLLRDGLEENRTALQAIGYRQVVEYLHGERSLAETVELVKQRTRQFAKRQRTWFRHQMSLNWVLLEADANLELVARKLVEKIR